MTTAAIDSPPPAIDWLRDCGSTDVDANGKSIDSAKRIQKFRLTSDALR